MTGVQTCALPISGDADYNKQCLANYIKTGDYKKLINEIMYQDTDPREKVIWAMMQAGCYEDETSGVAEFIC